MSWINKKKGYKPLVQENNSDSQEENTKAFVDNTNIESYTESNSISSSENKETSLAYSLSQQPNKEKLKKKKNFKMSKRSLKITTEAIVSNDNKDRNVKKKIKVLNEQIAEKILELDESLEVENHKVSKFLLIFAQLTKTMTSEETFEETDETDGIVSDTVSIICNLITDLLKNNIDELSIPKPIKISLKILERIFKLIKDKELEHDAEFSRGSKTTEETGETSGEGGEEQRSDSGEE